MMIVLIISAVLVMVSKLCDVLSTIKYVGETQELNQIARILFARLGFKPTLWVVFAFVVIVCAGAVAVVWLLKSKLLIILLSVYLFIVSAFQFSVAYFNVFKKHNFLTRIVAHFYFSQDFWNKILRRRRT